ncbi:hypothetical protein [Niabella ginsenosidivorans]|uniref:hypothetical protein n=1 Tax=Niabella ginsenosidivorans TaxID=1176587 RepID=UPI0012ECDF64|nr:hypothetical protein [Niabella ginsenosidivorans]
MKTTIFSKALSKTQVLKNNYLHPVKSNNRPPERAGCFTASPVFFKKNLEVISKHR